MKIWGFNKGETSEIFKHIEQKELILEASDNSDRNIVRYKLELRWVWKTTSYLPT